MLTSEVAVCCWIWHGHLFNLTNNQFYHVTDIGMYVITIGKGELICDTCMQRSCTQNVNR